MFLLAVETLCSELMSANTSCVSALFTRDQLLMSVTLVLLAHCSAAPRRVDLVLLSTSGNNTVRTLCTSITCQIYSVRAVSPVCSQTLTRGSHVSRSYENEFGSSAIAGAL